MAGKSSIWDPAGLFHAKYSYATQLIGINLQTSCYGGVLPLLYGTTRASANMVDFDDFTAYSQQQSTGKGGNVNVSWTYSVGAILALCEGPITGVNRVWVNGTETGTSGSSALSYLGASLFTGTRPQVPWSVWRSKHPQKAIAYAGMAYVACDTWQCGTSGNMSSYGFEVQGLLATEPDTQSLITLGIGNGVTTNFYLLDLNGNQITDSTTPPFSGYFNPTYYVNGVLQSSGISVGKIGAAYALTFTAAPASNAVVAWSTTAAVMSDAMPSNVLVDFLTNATHGAGWSSAKIGTQITGCPFGSGAAAILTWCNANPSSWQAYCTAMGWAVSPCFNAQKTAADHLKDLLQATNSEAVWAAGASGCYLNVIPYGDTPVTANGVTYTPNTTPLYSLTYNDFLGVVDVDGKPTGDDPVECTRTSVADVYNIIPVEWYDRYSAYNVSTVQDPEPVDVALHGNKVGSTVTQHMITRRAHALALSRILAQKSVYLRNQYKFRAGWRYMLLEPMDLIQISDPKLGLTNLVVRIISIDFPAKKEEADGLTFTCEAWPFGVGSPVAYLTGSTSSPSLSLQVPPGNTNTPVIFNVPALATQTGSPEIIIAASGGQYWGGCQVWMSYDNVTYSPIGVIQGQCRCGTLSATLPTSATGYPALDTVNTASVVQNSAFQRTFSTLSTGVAADLVGLLWVGSSGGDSELIGYQTAALMSAQNYNLTYLFRGCYGTTVSSHASGASWCFLDGTPFQFTLPTSRNGQTLYFKLPAFNVYGQAQQSLASVSAISYTPAIPSYPPPINVSIFSETTP